MAGVGCDPDRGVLAADDGVRAGAVEVGLPDRAVAADSPVQMTAGNRDPERGVQPGDDVLRVGAVEACLPDRAGPGRAVGAIGPVDVGGHARADDGRGGGVGGGLADGVQDGGDTTGADRVNRTVTVHVWPGPRLMPVHVLLVMKNSGEPNDDRLTVSVPVAAAPELVSVNGCEPVCPVNTVPKSCAAGVNASPGAVPTVLPLPASTSVAVTQVLLAGRGQRRGDCPGPGGGEPHRDRARLAGEAPRCRR